MPRQARVAPGGLVYHVINRANGRQRLFRKEEDFLAFEHVLAEALERVPTRLLGWCILDNHWHLIIWPRKDGELSAFMRWMTLTHVQRWHAAHKTSGTGHLYQGRFKSFPIERDSHLLDVLRYVHRNPLRPKLVRRAEQWRWSSLWVQRQGSDEQRALLSDWPIAQPRNWVATVNAPASEEVNKAILTSIRRGAPYGSPPWTRKITKSLNLQSTLRPIGRPKKELPPATAHQPRSRSRNSDT